MEDYTAERLNRLSNRIPRFEDELAEVKRNLEYDLDAVKRDVEQLRRQVENVERTR